MYLVPFVDPLPAQPTIAPSEHSALKVVAVVTLVTGIPGAIIGGAIGRKTTGTTRGTVAGAVLGAMVAIPFMPPWP